MDLASNNPNAGTGLRTLRLRLPGLGAPLRLAVPPSIDALLERLDTDAPRAEERIPYWAELWPSAEALARALLAGAGPRRPGRALELGCGLGLVGLCALRLGWQATLTDRDPEAIDLLRRNLAANGLPGWRAAVLDWRAAPPGRWDTVLAADVLYERPFAADLADFLDGGLAPGGRALIAEPHRPVAEDGLALLRERFAARELPLRARDGGRWRRVRLLELRRRG